MRHKSFHLSRLELKWDVLDRLHSHGVNFTGTLIRFTRQELLKMNGLGKKSVDHIEERLKAFNLYLGMPFIEEQPKWIDLTEEEINTWLDSLSMSCTRNDLRNSVRLIEAKLKEKNT